MTAAAPGLFSQDEDLHALLEYHAERGLEGGIARALQHDGGFPECALEERRGAGDGVSTPEG